MTEIKAQEPSSAAATYENENKTESASIDEFQCKTTGFSLNEGILKQEMADILDMMVSYMKDIETSAKTRRVKRLNHITGDYGEFCKEEKRFLRRLEYGKVIMNAIMESLEVVPDSESSGKVPAAELFQRINEFIQGECGNTTNNLKEMNFYLGELMVRFARICETEGVQHGLPIKTFPPVKSNFQRIYHRVQTKSDSNKRDEETEVDVREISSNVSSTKLQKVQIEFSKPSKEAPPTSSIVVLSSPK